MIDTLTEWAERYAYDPSVMDLVLWYPHLSWGEFAASLAAVALWRTLTDHVERALVLRLRCAVAWLLMRAADAIRP